MQTNRGNPFRIWPRTSDHNAITILIFGDIRSNCSDCARDLMSHRDGLVRLPTHTSHDMKVAMADPSCFDFDEDLRRGGRWNVNVLKDKTFSFGKPSVGFHC